MGCVNMAMSQNLVPLVNPKIAGKWMFIPLKMVIHPHIKSWSYDWGALALGAIPDGAMPPEGGIPLAMPAMPLDATGTEAPACPGGFMDHFLRGWRNK
jgi:hypothetical protein